MSSSIRILKTVNLPEETFEKGKIIFKEGDPGDTFFIVRRGSVGVYKNFEKPNQVELARVEAGRVLGELSAMDSRARSATAVALEEARVTRVNAQSLKYQLDQCPSWFKAVILDIVERLRVSGERLAQSGIADPSAHSSLKKTSPTEQE